MSAPPALPWGAAPAPPDPLRNAAANMALLGAARALVKSGASAGHGDAERVVTEALLDMSADRRIAAATILKQTEERIYAVIKRLQDGGSTVDVSAEDVRRALLDEMKPTRD